MLQYQHYILQIKKSLSQIKIERREGRNKLTWISAITKHLGIVAVLQKVLDVRQLMVNGYKIFMRNVRAHFNSANTKKWIMKCPNRNYKENKFIHTT
jgi:hypothetical protein